MAHLTTLGQLITPAPVVKCGEGSYPVLSMTMRDGIVLQSDRFKKSLASTDQSNYKVVKLGQLVVGFPIDEGVLYVQKVIDEGIMSPAYNVWNINTNLVNADYLELALHSPYAMDYYKSKLRGTTARRRTLPTRELLALPLPLPDFETQAKIVANIRKATELISLRKEQLAKLDQLVKSRFVELFGEGRDGKTPVKMLGSICKFQQGTQIPVDEQFEEQKTGYKRFLRIIDYTQAPQPPRYVNVNGKEVDEKSVVIVRYGATAGFVGRGYQGILANNLFEVMPDETILSKDFLFLALKYGTFEKEVHEKAFGAAMPALSFTMMNDISVVVPVAEEQKKFVSFVEQTDKSKLAIQASLDKLETLKKSLMQEYFG